MKLMQVFMSSLRKFGHETDLGMSSIDGDVAVLREFALGIHVAGNAVSHENLNKLHKVEASSRTHAVVFVVVNVVFGLN